MPENLIWSPLSLFFWQIKCINIPIIRIYGPWHSATSSNTTEEPSIVKKINFPADHDSVPIQYIQTLLNWKQGEKDVKKLCMYTDKKPVV